MTDTLETNHALENARGWVTTIREMMAALASDDENESEEARERIHEAPLAVDVRSGWASPGSPMDAAEFQILLTTGGPALRIVGDLNAYGEPETARLEWQDWGTPWTFVSLASDDAKAVHDFAELFYFGD
jgi:hypothetical protein